MPKPHRFKRGDIVKQYHDETMVDYFHVEEQDTLDSGAQVLDAIGDKDGIMYGLDSDFCFPATLKELIEYREKL